MEVEAEAAYFSKPEAEAEAMKKLPLLDTLAPGMALVHTSLLASDIYRYMPGKTREYGN